MDGVRQSTTPKEAASVVAIIALIYVSICTREDQIHHILEANFLGLCVSGLWVPPHLRRARRRARRAPSNSRIFFGWGGLGDKS
jgi:hypothetical protein